MPASAMAVESAAFAVYSVDNQSLDFYKRQDIPSVGSIFDGKTVTNVYTGFETACYGTREDSDNYIPWASISDHVLSAEVVDDGIAPVSVAHWFDYFTSMRTCNLTKLNFSRVTSMNGTFWQNYALSSLSISTTNFSSVTDMYATFDECGSLAFDCSTWNVPNVINYEKFNNCAPGVTLPVPWQPMTFSVPTKIPFALKADGSSIGPTASAWRIENRGSRAMSIRSTSASGFSDGSAVKATSEKMPLTNESGSGTWYVSADRGGRP